jgi:ParB-like chromosome segregation protein Spo0J
MTQLRDIPLAYIRSTLQNPRSDLAEDDNLRGLAASLGSEDDPQLAGPPVVEEMGTDDYRILAGERRIRAARLAGWQRIACLVRQRLDPAQAHTLRLVENLHRQELHPLDKAAALKIAWYTANADALGLQAQAREILEIEQTPAETLTALETLLQTTHDFPTTRPPVSWDTVFDRLGLEMEPSRRKRLLRVLGIESEIQERVREIDMSEASLRALGQLEAEDQAKLVAAIEEDPELAQKVRRIAHAVNHQDYELDEAVQEAQGQVVLDEDDPEDDQIAPSGDDQEAIDEDLLMDTVVALMEMADQWEGMVTTLNELAQGNTWQDLPEPWGAYAQEAYEKIKREIEKGASNVV